jgi:hypothetical protein
MQSKKNIMQNFTQKITELYLFDKSFDCVLLFKKDSILEL